MNSCILMAQITEAAQLRYTQDNQLAIAELTVKFAALRPEEPAVEMKAIGWGNTAQDIASKYQVGDHVVIEGRLGMNTIERPEGFKEKRAELTISRIYDLASLGSEINAPAPAFGATSTPSSTPKTPPNPPALAEEDFDEIPF